jgi:hypothetical protein
LPSSWSSSARSSAPGTCSWRSASATVIASSTATTFSAPRSPPSSTRPSVCELRPACGAAGPKRCGLERADDCGHILMRRFSGS